MFKNITIYAVLCYVDLLCNFLELVSTLIYRFLLDIFSALVGQKSSTNIYSDVYEQKQSFKSTRVALCY